MKIKRNILQRKSMLLTKLLLHNECINHTLVLKIEKHISVINKTLAKLS